jgi:hypothetical protein
MAAPRGMVAARGVPVSSPEVVAAVGARPEVAEAPAPHRGPDSPSRTCTAGTPYRTGVVRSILMPDRHWLPPPPQ